MDKKTPQKMHGNTRSSDDADTKYLKREAISERKLLKLIDLSRVLDAEEKQRLQTNIEIIAKASEKFV